MSHSISVMSNSGFELESLSSTSPSPTSTQRLESYRPLAYSISSVSKGAVSVPSHRSSQAHFLEDPKILEDTQSSRVIERRQNGLFTFYQSLSWMFGFKEKFSLLLFLSCGGALLGYCLARAYLMNSRIMVEQTVPGEFRWFDLRLYRVNYIVHIYLSIAGGILVGLQFFPAIRRKSVLLHRLNGYACLGILIVANITGGIVARRSFGAEINAQSAYYTLAVMYVTSAAIGYWYVKRNTRAHRKWMLRSVVYFSVIITARLIMLASRLIVTEIGTYYSLWRCDEVFFVLQDENILVENFPQCSSSTPNENGIMVPVHASVHEGPLGTASAVRVVQGMTLWIATLLHLALCETYIRSTESSNYSRHGFVLEPRDYKDEKSPGSFW